MPAPQITKRTRAVPAPTPAQEILAAIAEALTIQGAEKKGVVLNNMITLFVNKGLEEEPAPGRPQCLREFTLAMKAPLDELVRDKVLRRDELTLVYLAAALCNHAEGMNG